MPDHRSVLIERLTDQQRDAVSSPKRRLLVIAGAGSGKTEVMARRIAWWVAVDGVPKDSIAAFTFTERASEEMKFRIREWIGRVTAEGDDATLGGMYVGTIHGFCLKQLRELQPDDYHNYDIIDEVGRVALVQRGYYRLLGLPALQQALGAGQYQTIDTFLRGYDLLNEYDRLDVELSPTPPPHRAGDEEEWCREARLLTDVGSGEVARAFAESAARYYAYTRCRRFLDFSTSQTEYVRALRGTPDLLDLVRGHLTHIVVDEVQDINPVQEAVIRTHVGSAGSLTAVGDHRQAIFGWRGGKVDIMAGLHEELSADPGESEVIELPHNFRSTPRVINLANRWADTIGPVRAMASPAMEHGREEREDRHASHVAVLEFDEREDEAEWIAQAIGQLVREDGTGAFHDTRDGERGLTYSDIGVLVRSSTDARTYMDALRQHGIPAVFRAGPDLFSQPEVLLFLASLARMAGLDAFYGADWDRRSLPNRIATVLSCLPDPAAVIPAAVEELGRQGLDLQGDVADRLLLVTELIRNRLEGGPPPSPAELGRLRNPQLADLLRRTRPVRRVFPQALFQMLLAEAGVEEWDASADRRAQVAMFHLGQLSSLVKGIETPGWTSTGDFKYQMIALCLWGSQNARTEEAPLLVPPDAVTISTIHSVKGLEFAAVFLVDVNARRFPSSFARRQPDLPFDGPILNEIDPADLADNGNYDSERRLMYVGLTRAERYLFISCSGSQRSAFLRGVKGLVRQVGGTTDAAAASVPSALEFSTSEFRRDFRLVTSFSDLRYYLECPHDFYLRKVLGFSPGIDEAFGYGRGVHNLLRAIHANPRVWAELAQDPSALQAALETLVDRGLFYLRYTVGAPADTLRARAVEVVGDYVRKYSPELAALDFEPEREFETLLEEENVLVAGAMDLIRLDDPPRVTLIDFKSGEAKSDLHMALDEELMRLQVSIYGLAARRELEYEPGQGLVRYLAEPDGSKAELGVDLSEEALGQARATVLDVARSIRERVFDSGPRRQPRDPRHGVRCAECDYVDICGMQAARRYRAGQRR